MMNNHTNEDIELRSWVFPTSQEIDVEIWHEGRYVTTVTIDYMTGNVIHQTKASDLETI